MNWAIILATFAIIFPAELPDKSMVAAFVLGAKYKPLPVFVGMVAAFAVQVVIAVIAGNLLGLLPHRLLEVIVGALFGVGALLIVREDGGEQEAEAGERNLVGHPPAWKISATAFAVVFVAEFGDLTQIATANLSAKFHDPLAVGLGSVLALWSVGAIGIWGGQNLRRLIPMRWFTRVAALLLALLALASFIAAARD